MTSPAADADPGWAAYEALREAVEGLAADMDQRDLDPWYWSDVSDELRALLAAHPPSAVSVDDGATVVEGFEGYAVSAMHHDPLIPGTRVLAWPGTREGSPLVTRTRGEVWRVGGTSVVRVEGYAGGIALDHVDVLPDRTEVTE